MRNHRKHSLGTDWRLYGGRWPLGLLLATSLWPLGASGQGTAAKVKYTYKPVPCSPCPCQCPNSSGKAPGARVVTSPRPVAPPLRDAAALPAGTPPLALARREVAAGPAAPAPAGASGETQSLPSAATGSLGGLITLRDSSGKELADRAGVVVYITEIPGKKYAPLKRGRELAQRDKQFDPGLVAITRGSVVNFPNDDKLMHDVFSLSVGNTFDLGIYSAGETKSVTFEKTGVVDVFCNIHPNMWAQILVLDNPFFTTTEKDGRFALNKLPPGTYTVAARFFGGEPVTQPVQIEPGKRSEIALIVQRGAKSKAHGTKTNGPYPGVYKN